MDTYGQAGIPPEVFNLEQICEPGPGRVFKRFGAQFTPTLVLLDQDGTKRYRFEGYPAPEEFLAHLQLALAKSAFAQEKWKESEQRCRQIAAAYVPRPSGASLLRLKNRLLISLKTKVRIRK